MAKEKEAKTILERTYNIPLRKEFLKVPRWNRAHKAVTAARQFLAKHFKSEEIKLGVSINKNIWARGAQHPPHHVKVTAVKDDKGVVKAELFGAVEKKAPAKKEKKAATEKKVEAKTETPVEKKEIKKEVKETK